MVHDHHHPMCLEMDGFATEEIYTPKAVFHVTNYRQPGRAVAPVAWYRSVMLGQNTPDDIFVDLDAEGSGNLLSNSWTAKPRISSLHLHNALDNCLGWSSRPRFPLSLRRKESAVFALLERIVKFEQSRRTDDDCDSLQSNGLDEGWSRSPTEIDPKLSDWVLFSENDWQ